MERFKLLAAIYLCLPCAVGIAKGENILEPVHLSEFSAELIVGFTVH